VKNEQRLLTGKLHQLIWSFALPAIGAMVINAAYNAVDRIYVGRIPEVGHLAMTGIGLTAPLITVVFAFMMLLTAGATLLISIKLGARQPAPAQRIFNNAQELMIITMVGFTAITLLLLRPLMSFFGADDLTAPYALDYLAWIAVGFLFNGFGFFYIGIIRSAGHPKESTLCLLSGAIFNIILDPIFIFTFNLGVAGAAIATTISQLLACLLCIYFIRRPHFPLVFQKLNFRFDYSLIRTILKSGLPAFLIQVAQSFVLIIINHTLLRYGNNDSVAVMTIVFSINLLILFPAFGYLQGLQPIIGFNYGAKQFLRVRQALKLATKHLFLYTVVIFCLVELFPAFLMRIFTTEEHLINFGTTVTRIFFAALPTLGIGILGSNFFQYTHQPRTAIFLSALRQIIMQIPLLFLVPYLFSRLGGSGTTGVFVALLLSDVIANSIIALYYVRGVRKLPLSNAPLPPPAAAPAPAPATTTSSVH
jgi:putative MATE family efflux protein